MHHVRQENLPFVGSSHEFIGAEQGGAGISFFLFHGKPGSGQGHIVIPMTRFNSFARATAYGRSTERPGAGDIFVIKAGEVHSFGAIGDSPLIQFDVHLSPRFIQENL